MKTLKLLALGVTLSTITYAQDTLRVDWQATGNNDGTSWADAFTTIQAANAVANSDDEIWVADGTYYPSLNNDPAEYIILAPDVEMYGGFNATETTRDQRDWAVNVTVIDGNIGNAAISSDNSRWLIRNFNSGDLVIDGFTLQNGYADCYCAWENIYFSNTNAVLNNLIIKDNYSSRSGLFVTHGTCEVIVSNSLIFNNEGKNGVLAYNTNSTSSYNFINCTFSDNTVNRSSCVGPNITFQNSILEESGNAGSLASFDYCIVDFSTSSATTQDNTNPDLDINYYPNHTSPAINEGNTTYNSYDYDLGNKKRISGSSLDIGAYEFQEALYVDWQASGNNDGTSWADAFTTIQAANAVANSDDEIWVAEGTYYPSLNNDPAEYIILAPDVEMYGGFNATETTRDQRDWAVNVTVIDGNIGNTSISSDNSRWLIRNFNSGDLVIDGFTLQNGYADCYCAWENIYFSNTNAVLNNLIIKDNYSSRSGLFVTHGTCEVVVSNSLIFNNEGRHGVLAYNTNSTSSYNFINCTIVENTVNSTSCIGPNISFQNSILNASGNAGSLASFDYCIVDFSTSSATTQDNTNPDLDVNFYPNSSSPAIDAGDNSYNTANLDLGHATRIINTTIDVGAYEYNSASPRLKFSETDLENNISIYPNPSNGNFNITLNASDFTQIVIKDLTGKTVKIIQLTKQENRINLDLTDQPSGIYLVDIQGNTNRKTMKINKL